MSVRKRTPLLERHDAPLSSVHTVRRQWRDDSNSKVGRIANPSAQMAGYLGIGVWPDPEAAEQWWDGVRFRRIEEALGL